MRIVKILFAVYQLLLSLVCIAGIIILGIAVLSGKGGLHWDNILLASLIVIPTMIYCLFNAVRLLVSSRYLFRWWSHLSGTSYVFTILFTLLFLGLLIFETDWGSNRMEKLTLTSLMKSSSLQVGQKAPDFSAQDQYGQSISISNLRGKHVLLDFWATWCGPCIKELANVEKIYEEFREEGIVVIGINVDKDAQKFRDFIESRGMMYSQIYDDKEEIARAYDVYAIPEIFLINGQGVVVSKERGRRLRNTVRRELTNSKSE